MRVTRPTHILWPEGWLTGHSGGPHPPTSMWGNEVGIRYPAPTPTPWHHVAPPTHPRGERKEEP